MSCLSTVPVQVKYGLIDKKTTTKTAAFAAKPKSRAVLRAAAGFEEEDALDEDSDGGGEDSKASSTNKRGDVRRVNQSLAAQSNSAAFNATAEDASGDIYDYDSYLENKESTGPGSGSSLSSGSTRIQQSASAQSAPKASYVHNLKSAASMREREKDRLFEKKLVKERLAEEAQMEAAAKATGIGGVAGNELKFVTTAYKKKLQEAAKWEEEDRLMEMVEKNTGGQASSGGGGGGGMTGFYSNLLTKNIAMGSATVEEAALSAYTSGSRRQQKMLQGDGEEVREEERQGGDVGEREGSSSSSSSSRDRRRGRAEDAGEGDGGSEKRPRKDKASSHGSDNDDVDDSGSAADAVNKEVEAAAAAAEAALAAAAEKEARINSARERYFLRRVQGRARFL